MDDTRRIERFIAMDEPKRGYRMILRVEPDLEA
jgi:hypothetical protein